MTARIKTLRVIREDWRSGNQYALHGRLREEDPTCYSLELKLLADRAFLEGFKLWLSQQRIDVGPCADTALGLTSGAPICPRQHLSPAAEQQAREEQGPCPCASCVACRARPMAPNQDVLHLHADGSVTVRSGPEAVAEWEARVRRSWEEP